ncbi:hypothetical protein D3P08_18550, partial [Paenibacillus nanensis]
MKAYVYALRSDGVWKARMTIEPKVDLAFWFGGGQASRSAEAAWLWKEALPLGLACQVAERWGEKAARDRKGDRSQNLSHALSYSAYVDGLMELERAVRVVCDGAARPPRRRWLGALRPGAGRTEAGDARALLARAELWHAREHGDAGIEAAAAAAAERAAELLQGRALLSGEARDLLAGAGGPGAAASWREAVQLAALLGRVRLGGAVAAHG